MITGSELQAIVKAGRETAYKAIAHQKQATLTLHPMALLTILDMLEGCHGYTRLVRDDGLDRLESAVERLEKAVIAMDVMK